MIKDSENVPTPFQSFLSLIARLLGVDICLKVGRSSLNHLLISLSYLMNKAISGRSPSFSPREFNDVCMTLPGGGCRLQTCRGLAAQWFDSTLRTLDGLYI